MQIIGKNGRNFLLFSIFIILFDIPVRNTIENTAQLAKWGHCSLQSGVQQALVAGGLFSEPMKQIITNYIEAMTMDGQLLPTERERELYNRMDTNFRSIYGKNKSLPEDSDDRDRGRGDPYELIRQNMTIMCNEMEDKLKHCFSEFAPWYMRLYSWYSKPIITVP